MCPEQSFRQATGRRFAAFANNIIPAAQINSVAGSSVVLSLAECRRGNKAAWFHKQPTSRIHFTDNRQYTGRIDYSLSSTQQFL